MTPLFELGDQDSLRFDDLARLRMATFGVDSGIPLGFAARARWFISIGCLPRDAAVMCQHGTVLFPPPRAGSAHVVQFGPIRAPELPEQIAPRVSRRR